MRSQNVSTMQKVVYWFCDHIWTKIDAQDQLFTIQLDITNSCNLRCNHCYCPHHQNEGALSFEQWCLVLDQYETLLTKLHMKANIILCGGEPLLSPFLFKLLREIRNRFVVSEICILSNGTLLKPELVVQLKEFDVQLQISLDGPDAKRHDSIRGTGNFVKTMEGCALLKKKGVSFHHLAVLSEKTSVWIEDFFQLAKTTGAIEMNFVRLIVEGHAKQLFLSGEDRPLARLSLKQSYQRILQASRATGVSTSTHGALWHLIEDGLGTPNNIGICGMVVNYRGEVKASSRTSFVLGNVFTEGLEKLFLHHPVMKKLRQGRIDLCGECNHFQKCRGDRNTSFATYGHFFGPDLGCWVLPQKQLNDYWNKKYA